MKYNAKCLAALLLIGCTLAAPALGEGAQTIARRVNAPETVTLPVQTPGKHSTLAFDAKVYVPQVAKAPIFQVKIDDIPEETIFAAADALGLTDINRKASAWNYDESSQSGKTESYHGYASGWRQFYRMVNRYCAGQPEAVTYSNLYSNYFKKAEYYLGRVRAVPYPGTAREGTMTRDSAYNIALETIGAFTQGYRYTLEVEGALGGEAQLTDAEMNALRTGKKDPKSVPKHPYAFAFYFAPEFAGIPITQASNTGWWQSEEYGEMIAQMNREGHEEPMSCGVDSRLMLAVLDEGVHGMEWNNPLSVIGAMKEDTELLPFEDILERAKVELSKYCFKSESCFESEESCWDIVVTEIRFGYMCKQMEPGSMDLRLVPVWDFMVKENLIRNGEWKRLDNYYGHSAVTLSAEDGSIVNR